MGSSIRLSAAIRLFRKRFSRRRREDRLWRRVEAAAHDAIRRGHFTEASHWKNYPMSMKIVRRLKRLESEGAWWRDPKGDVGNGAGLLTQGDPR